MNVHAVGEERGITSICPFWGGGGVFYIFCVGGGGFVGERTCSFPPSLTAKKLPLPLWAYRATIR